MPPPPLISSAPTTSRQAGGAAANTLATSRSPSRRGSSASTKSSSRPSSTMLTFSPQQLSHPPSSSPRPRSSSAVSITECTVSSSVPSSPRAPRSGIATTTTNTSMTLPTRSPSSSRTSFLAPSRSSDRLGRNSPSSNTRPQSISSTHDPHLTPTPSSRKHSLSSSSSLTSLAATSSRRPASGDYRYSLGPAPVRFPKNGGGTDNSAFGGADADASTSVTKGTAMLSASPTSSTASTLTAAARRQRTPSPSGSRSRSSSSTSFLTASGKKHTTGSSKSEERLQRPQATEEALDDQEVTPRPTRTPSQVAMNSEAFQSGTLPLLEAKDKRSSTRTSSSATLRGNYVGDTSSIPHENSSTGTGSPSTTATVHLQRPGMPPRPSSKVLTTFPFPHPTTPRGTLDEEGRHLPALLGFSWVSKLFGGAGGQPSEAEDEERVVSHQEESRLESRSLLPSQEAPSGPFVKTTSKEGKLGIAGRGYGTILPSASSQQAPQQSQMTSHSQFRRPSQGQQPRRNPSLSSLATSEPDASDPYGYRRLAGPDLLPTYHADHVNPRRRKREMQKRWEKRRRIWIAVGASLLVLGVLFVGIQAWRAIQDGKGEGEGKEEEGDAGIAGVKSEIVEMGKLTSLRDLSVVPSTGQASLYESLDSL